MKREFPLKTRDTGKFNPLRTTTHRHRQEYGISKGKGGCGKEEEDLEGINGDGRRCDLG